MSLKLILKTLSKEIGPQKELASTLMVYLKQLFFRTLGVSKGVKKVKTMHFYQIKMKYNSQLGNLKG